MFRFAALALGGLLGLGASASAAVIVDKTPDLGPYWQPLDGTPNGTYVYTDSFVFTGATGTLLDTVGVYLLSLGGAGTPFRYEVYADNANAPNPASVLGTSGYMQDANTTLHLDTATLLSPFALTNGSRYWIAASTVGQPSQGAYQFGGHTQNSIYADNGTFWFSNDPAGLAFDGQRLTPEIAIYAASVGIAAVPVPEPATLALVSVALGLMGARVRVRRGRTNTPAVSLT